MNCQWRAANGHGRRARRLPSCSAETQRVLPVISERRCKDLDTQAGHDNTAIDSGGFFAK